MTQVDAFEVVARVDFVYSQDSQPARPVGRASCHDPQPPTGRRH
ncbi:MAG: hypothetical protein ACRDUX_12815 [Mycobacterium sp.]